MRSTIFLLAFLICGLCFSQNPDPFWDGIRTKLVQPDTLSTFDRDALTPKLGTILYHKDTGVSRWEQWDGSEWVEFGAGAEYTFSDTAEIDLTLTGDDVTADIVAGSIDETKLDASVNSSLDLADSALQSATLQQVLDTGNTTTTDISLNGGNLTGTGNIDLNGDLILTESPGELQYTGKYLRLTVASDDEIDHPIIEVWRSREAGWLQNGNELGALAFRGNPPYSNGAGAGINVFATEDWGPSNEGTELRIFTTPNGTNTKGPHAIFQNNGNTAFGGNILIGGFGSPLNPLTIQSDGVGLAHRNTSNDLRIYTQLVNDHSRFNMVNASGTNRILLNTFGVSYFSGGNVAIGKTTASEALDVQGNGAFTGTVTATNFILSSDKRLKENFKDLGNGYYSFNFKGSKEKRYGVIAQEVKEYAPELVSEGEDGYLKVAYIDLLIKKIAELEARVKELEKK